MKPGDVIPSNSVIIPTDVAKRVAGELRALMNVAEYADNDPRREWADLLDPQPPSLREQVAQAMQDTFKPNPGATLAKDLADAALAVVADWLAAQPLELGVGHDPAECVRGAERDHDVRLLRGQS